LVDDLRSRMLIAGRRFDQGRIRSLGGQTSRRSNNWPTRRMICDRFGVELLAGGAELDVQDPNQRDRQNGNRNRLAARQAAFLRSFLCLSHYVPPGPLPPRCCASRNKSRALLSSDTRPRPLQPIALSL